MLIANATNRFKFIGHALDADGPFRPVVSIDSGGQATLSGHSYLVRYPRESDQKFARRNEVAFYASPLARATNRFVGYLSSRPPTRELRHDLYEIMADNVDGKGNAIDVFFAQFAQQAKARGSMLLLVDMPATMPPSLGAQVEQRAAPFWSAIKPESLVEYQVGDDGKFDRVEFAGNWSASNSERIECVWHFDRVSWRAIDAREHNKVLAEGEHPLGECPVLMFTETGDFPCFGQFSAIADLARRMFNAESELDEILRAQTFSLLTMQVPDGTTDAAKLKSAQVAGETIGTSNLMVHSGSTPAFIAPPDGPARVYLDRIASLSAQIDEIALVVQGSQTQESGIALQMRFAALNGELAGFSARLEDIERRAWELSRRWLGMTQAPEVQWPRDFNLADIETEMKILTDMQAAAMPRQVIAEQQKRIVAVQFAGLGIEQKGEINQAIDERLMEPEPSGNVIPIDRNFDVRAALLRELNGGAGNAAA